MTDKKTTTIEVAKLTAATLAHLKAGNRIVLEDGDLFVSAMLRASCPALGLRLWAPAIGAVRTPDGEPAPNLAEDFPLGSITIPAAALRDGWWAFNPGSSRGAIVALRVVNGVAYGVDLEPAGEVGDPLYRIGDFAVDDPAYSIPPF